MQCVQLGPVINQKKPNTQFLGHKLLQPVKLWYLESPIAFLKNRVTLLLNGVESSTTT